MKKYYEIGFNATKNKALIELVKTKLKLMEEDISDNHIDGLYKQKICEIRRDFGIKNVISLDIATHKETKEQRVNIYIYDYELPSEEWNCWTEVKYDEDKKLRYIQMEEDINE